MYQEKKNELIYRSYFVELGSIWIHVSLIRVHISFLLDFGKNGDPQDILSRYQASLEARCYGNMEEARLLWTEVMTRHGNQAQYWLEFVELERYNL